MSPFLLIFLKSIILATNLVSSNCLATASALSNSKVDDNYEIETTTVWPYEAKFYCWTSPLDCHHPASTPFPGVDWKRLNTKYKNRPWQSWWEYPCFYYSEEALMSLQGDTDNQYLTFTCAGDREDESFAWINGTLYYRHKLTAWDQSGEISNNLVAKWDQPMHLEAFFERNNLSGSIFAHTN